MAIRIKRIYDPVEKDDGLRVLIDRLWPRGMTKDKARVDRWLREIAPSTELRTWYQHDRTKWVEFKRRYFAELKTRPDLVQELRSEAARGTVTLLFASREQDFNHAVALKAFLSTLPVHEP